ncbi:MAG: alpha/beta hydrolase [Actinomycetota bacterium]|nr:alpha/beta hydrolase [Actinomycetota bacterium]
MPTAEANGLTLYYEEHGEGEPLLCVQGLSVNTLGWALQVQAFAAAHRTVIFDNRDVGRSTIVESGYEIAAMAADALALADVLGLDRFHLLGVSMGGAVAQEVALGAPDRVSTLTLGVTFARGGAWARKLGETWGARRLKQSREEHIDELLLLTLSEGFYENEGAVDYVRGLMLADPNPQPAEAFVRQLEASSRHDAHDRLGSLELPTHVIGGEHDILIPVWKSRELAELVPGARLTVIEGSPHGANLERAEEFNRLVLDFVAEVNHRPTEVR